MINPERARKAATSNLESLRFERDQILQPWGTVVAGEPVLVYDVAGPSSYWIVPVLSKGHVIGFVRIGADGGIMAIGVTCRTPTETTSCPKLVTGISADEASAKVLAEQILGEDETLGPPRFVHDGPPGREVWRVETTLDTKPYRWFFVSPAGIYHRPAGLRIGEDPDRE